jgi:hypothetical protein
MSHSNLEDIKVDFNQSGEGLYVEGIGWIAQHHSWCDMLWEKGIPFFFRDLKAIQVAKLAAAKPRSERLQLELEHRRAELAEWHAIISAHAHL